MSFDVDPLRFDLRTSAILLGARIKGWLMPVKNVLQRGVSWKETVELLTGPRRIVFCGSYGTTRWAIGWLCKRRNGRCCACSMGTDSTFAKKLCRIFRPSYRNHLCATMAWFWHNSTTVFAIDASFLRLGNPSCWGGSTSSRGCAVSMPGCLSTDSRAVAPTSARLHAHRGTGSTCSSTLEVPLGKATIRGWPTSSTSESSSSLFDLCRR